MLNGINEEGVSDDRYKVKVKNHSGETTKDICDYIKYAKKYAKLDIIIVHAGTNDITTNIKSFEKKIMDTIKSKLPNYKYAISNVIMRKGKQT